MAKQSPFTHWSRWQDRNSLPNLHFPGVYAIALVYDDIAGQEFSWRQEIIYFGMTNSQGGLKSRLQQLDRILIGKQGSHGGARRIRFKYANYDVLVLNLYVSVASRPCDVRSNAPQDLRIMGDVAKFEYDCLATYVAKFGCLPEFNDKKRSPKK